MAATTSSTVENRVAVVRELKAVLGCVTDRTGFERVQKLAEDLGIGAEDIPELGPEIAAWRKQELR